MRKLLLGVVLLCSITSAGAQLSVGIGLPGVSIGINLPVYPQLVPVPGYPVYYAPQVNSNYFFYDGMYWVYQRDNWYASSWYNGPWGLVAPEVVPLFVLRVPVRYYRQPPGVLSRLAIGCAAALGRALGQYVGAASAGMGRLGSQCGVPAGSAAGVPAPIFRKPLSARRAAAGAAGPALPLPAAGCRRAAALSGAAGEGCGGAAAGKAASSPGSRLPAAGAAEAAEATAAATATAATAAPDPAEAAEAPAGAGPAGAAGPEVPRAGRKGTRQGIRAAAGSGACQGEVK